jgi:hypothetical protein
MKFERPSRIQSSTLPMILTPPYKDLIAQAHNGSGKTTCFVLSMLSRCGGWLLSSQTLRGVADGVLVGGCAHLRHPARPGSLHSFAGSRCLCVSSSAWQEHVGAWATTPGALQSIPCLVY